MTRAMPPAMSTRRRMSSTVLCTSASEVEYTTTRVTLSPMRIGCAASAMRPLLVGSDPVVVCPVCAASCATWNCRSATPFSVVESAIG